MDRRYRVEEDVGTTLSLGIAVWGVAVVAATFSGIFSRLPVQVLLALAAFLTVFSVASLFLDPGVREFVATVRGKILVSAVVLMVALAGLGLEIALLFSMPLGAAAITAIALRPRTPRFRSPARKSPAGTRAAT